MNLFDDPMENIPDIADVQAFISKKLIELLESRQQPSALEILSMLKDGYGPWVVFSFPDEVRKLREDPELKGYHRAYLKTELSDANIWAAITGEEVQSEEHKSTLDDLFAESQQYRNSAAFREMIEFTAKFTEYAPYNNMLVRIQNPACSFYATQRDWKNRFDRSLKRDARPMLILAPMHPVMLVYDLDQTTGPDLPKHLLDFSVTQGEFDDKWMDRLIENAERNGIMLESKSLSSTNGGFATRMNCGGNIKARIVLHDKLDLPSAFGVLCHELAHIYLGHLGGDPDGWWPSRRNLSHSAVEVEAEAVAYIVAIRLGLKPSSASYVCGHLQSGQVPNGVSLDLIGKKARMILDMTERLRPKRKKKGEKDG